MLILERKKGQQIIIGDMEIIITLFDVEKNSAKIGIEASKAITVHRKEVYDRINKPKVIMED